MTISLAVTAAEILIWVILTSALFSKVIFGEWYGWEILSNDTCLLGFITNSKLHFSTSTRPATND